MTQDQNQFADSLDRLAAAPADFSKAATAGIPLIAARIEKNYDDATTAGGVAWAPHAPATVRRYGPHPLLILSGKMQAASIVPGDPGHIERVTPEGLDFGVDKEEVPYAGFHQDGTTKMPQREFIAIDDETADKLAELVADEAVKQFMA